MSVIIQQEQPSGGPGGGPTFESSVALSGSSSVSLASAIAAGARLICITLDHAEVVSNNTSIGLRLVDSGGEEATGYDSDAFDLAASANSSTTQFQLNDAGFDSIDFLSGVIWLSYTGDGSNSWHISGNTIRTGGATQRYVLFGDKALSGEITGVNLNSGSNFNGGVASLAYWVE